MDCGAFGELGSHLLCLEERLLPLESLVLTLVILELAFDGFLFFERSFGLALFDYFLLGVQLQGSNLHTTFGFYQLFAKIYAFHALLFEVYLEGVEVLVELLGNGLFFFAFG